MGVLPFVCVGFHQVLYMLLWTGGGKGVQLKGGEARGEELNTGEE